MADAKNAKKPADISPKKSFKKLKMWLTGIFVAISYHFFLMSFGAALRDHGYQLDWPVLASSISYYGELVAHMTANSDIVVDGLQSSSEQLASTWAGMQNR